MSGILEGKTVTIMGVGPSLGRATALACAEQGANLVLAARSQGTMDAVAKEVAERGAQAISVSTDMTNPADCKKLVAAAVERFGRIDGHVSVAHRAEDNKIITEMDDELSEWRNIMNTNFFGTLQLAKVVIEQMQKQPEGGSIVLINSMTSHLTWPRLLPYASSKAALAAATRALALEYGPNKIRVNSLHCGAILNEDLWDNLSFMAGQEGTTKEEQYERIAALSPLGSIATPEEYAGSVLYLLSGMSTPTTGISLHVNSGRYMG